MENTYKEKIIKAFESKNAEYEIIPTSFIEKYNDKKIVGNGLTFYETPASVDKYGVYEAGLIDYILNVTSKMIHLNDTIKQEHLKIETKTLVKVGFLHAIGKIGMFTRAEQWRKNKGQHYQYVNDNPTLTVPHRSLLFINNEMDVKLSFEEMQAITTATGKEDDFYLYYGEYLSSILRSAVDMTIKQMCKEHSNN